MANIVKSVIISINLECEKDINFFCKSCLEELFFFWYLYLPRIFYK